MVEHNNIEYIFISMTLTKSEDKSHCLKEPQ